VRTGTAQLVSDDSPVFHWRHDARGANLGQEVNIRLALAVALFMAQAGCGRLGGPGIENWGSYPDGNVKAEWLPDGRSMKLLETFRYIDANGVTWTAPKDSWWMELLSRKSFGRLSGALSRANIVTRRFAMTSRVMSESNGGRTFTTCFTTGCGAAGLKMHRLRRCFGLFGISARNGW